MREGDLAVTILWHANPFRGDKFEEAWRSHAEAALDYGASSWAFMRSKDDPLDFMQMAVFPSKQEFERYWYSEELSEARTECMGLFQVPILPVWFTVKGVGDLAAVEAPD